jgi:mono/diheme cytochrome c family protein/DNA-binding beta-propeller fold protein YncE
MRHAAAVIGVLALGAALAPVRAPAGAAPADPAADAELAAKARAVLKTHCYRCHGLDGAAEGGFNTAQDRRRLVERNRVVPGSPDRSPLLDRVLKGEMPPEGEKPRPTEDEVATLKKWVEAGAPDWAAAPPPRRFISVREITELVDKDAEKDRRVNNLYFTLTHLYNAGYSEDELQTVRVALARILNSTSASEQIVIPTPLDPEKTVLKVELRELGWTWEQWRTAVFTDPFAVRLNFKNPVGVGYKVSAPIRADWFVFTASRPPVYHALAGVPFTLRELEEKLKVDADANIKSGKVLRSGFNGSGVSRNNRLLERHEGEHGYYWRSYDFAGSVGRQNLFASPLGPGGEKGFRHAGGEVIYRRPNGTQAYMLVNANGDRIDTAPVGIVNDPKHPDRVVENGISCMNCHARGLIDKADQIRPHVEKNRTGFTRAEYDAVRTLHPEAEKFSAAVKADSARYLHALRLLGGPPTGTDPVVAVALRFEDELDLRQAAAEAWTTPEELTKLLAARAALARPLGALRNGGTVSRKSMTAIFPLLVRTLKVTDEDFLADVAGVARPVAGRETQIVLGTAYEQGEFRVVKVGPRSAGIIPAPQIDPTFRHIAAVDADELTVKIFDASNGELQHTLPKHRDRLISMAFSGDGSRLATAGREGSIHVIDTRTGKVRAKTPAPGTNPTPPDLWGLALSPDGEVLASTGREQGEVQLWDANTGRRTDVLKAGTRSPFMLEFSPDGKRLLVIDGGISPLATMLDVTRDGKQLYRVFGPHDAFYSVGFSRDGKSVVMTTGAGPVRVYDAANGELRGTGKAGEAGNSSDRPGTGFSSAFSPDGKHLVTGHQDGTVVVWDAATVRALYAFQAHGRHEKVWGLRFSPDGKRLVSTSVGGSVRFWDANKILADTAGR